MCKTSDSILVAVSAGKDSLSLWDILNELGYYTFGIYIDLGIGEYSRLSREYAVKFARQKKLPLKIIVVEDIFNMNIVEIARILKRPACRVCGLIKRYLLNYEAQGFDCIATGHNLDDEASVLLGNIFKWQEGFLSRQYPVLQEKGTLKKKIKPLCFNLEEEIRYYADFRDIEYVKDPCPLSKHATSLFYKGIMNKVENRMPATKIYFYKEFIKQHYFKRTQENLVSCKRCGYLTISEICSFCKLKEELSKKVKVPV